VYLSRVWHVKPGSEDEFRRRWLDGVDELARLLPQATFRLWRDAEHPGRFHSVGGPVASDELDAIRGSEGFRRSMDALAEVLEDVEVSAFELVEEIG
jgi:hypothetical protein